MTSIKGTGNNVKNLHFITILHVALCAGEEDSVTQSREDETQMDKRLSELREPLLDETVVTPTRTS